MIAASITNAKNRPPTARKGRGFELALQFFIRDQSALLRESYFGWFWVILPPIMASAGFTLAQKSAIINMAPTGIPYAAHVFLGTILWQVFSGTIMAPITRTLKNAPLMSVVHVPPETIFFSELIRIGFDIALRLPLVIAGFFIFKLPVTWGILGACGVMIALLSFAMALGFLVALAAAMFEDIGRAMPQLLSLWLFLTPVFYPPPTGELTSLVAQLNPASPLISSVLELGTGRALSYPAGLVIVSGASLPMLLLSWFLYRGSLIYLIERRAMR